MKKHIDIKIFGLVQGVFFRTSAKEKAEKLSITGFAKNLSDGSVYIEVEGEKDSLEEFIKWCRKGPAIAKVDNIDTSEGKLKNFNNFQTG